MKCVTIYIIICISNKPLKRRITIFSHLFFDKEKMDIVIRDIISSEEFSDVGYDEVRIFELNFTDKRISYLRNSTVRGLYSKKISNKLKNEIMDLIRKGLYKSTINLIEGANKYEISKTKV